MTFVTYEDMANCIRRNLWKVPTNVDLVIGIPRSGMIAALILGELLNRRVTDVDSFLDGRIMQCGYRGQNIKDRQIKKVLVLDDTVFNGNSMQQTREKMKAVADKYEILYGCIYAEGRDAKSKVDIFFEDNYHPSNKCFYEWNILHHYASESEHMMFDMDGVLCLDPPDERDVARYEEYIANAKPMIIPATKIGAIVTYRLEKYRDVTTRWLQASGIAYGKLLMYQHFTHLDRSAEGAAAYKANIYKAAEWASLFVESDPTQAIEINRLSGKPVYCYSDGRMHK